ncbi:SH3 domain-containing protein [Bacteroidota bacterium]
MRRIIFLLSFSFICICINAQFGKTYHVISGLLNFREEPNNQSPIKYYLNRYENILVIDSVSYDEWAMIKYNKDTGYVSKKFIKIGACVVQSYDVRVGVRCKDGESFYTLNKSICASHGGFAYWITEIRQFINVYDD